MKTVLSSACCSLLLIAAACNHVAEHGHDHADHGAGHDHVDLAARVHVSDGSDARAIELAQTVVKNMGGWEAYDATRYLKWKFFGGRLHHWDRHTGNVRIEGTFGRGDDAREMLFLMNVDTREGRVWESGAEITDPEKLKEALQNGYEIWINDHYWVVMPFKLLDPGVTLKHAGERALEDGRAAEVLDLTFDSVGVTPENRYEIFVAKDTGLVEQWAFYSNKSDPEPRFTLPWTDWQRFGRVLIATKHQNPSDNNPNPASWEIEVFDELPDALFEQPDASTVANATSTG